jgi:hypothetical protein
MSSKEIPLIARRLPQGLEHLRARYDARAVMPGIYKAVRELEIQLACSPA